MLNLACPALRPMSIPVMFDSLGEILRTLKNGKDPGNKEIRDFVCFFEVICVRPYYDLIIIKEALNFVFNRNNKNREFSLEPGGKPSTWYPHGGPLELKNVASPHG